MMKKRYTEKSLLSAGCGVVMTFVTILLLVIFDVKILILFKSINKHFFISK